MYSAINKKSIGIAFISVFGVISTGCVSMDGRMVNANGETFDCSTSGGGFGLGMVVGAALAAASNQACESDAEDRGFILHDDVGKTGLTFNNLSGRQVLITASEPPAYPCVLIGDQVLEVDHKAIATLSDAKSAIFKESGDPIHLSISRSGIQQNCEFELN